MTYHLKTLALLATIGAGLAPAAQAEDVTIRYLASQGGLNAHELAAELGYFDGTGITLENVGYATGGPASLVALAG
ncbi:MAG: ABC transporter substrate-binding protein, partial [Rhodobacteraceae bacterium]|nr:ABC transporter substrate-binding protein [Paracoccaceae bacterium]